MDTYANSVDPDEMVHNDIMSHLHWIYTVWHSVFFFFVFFYLFIFDCHPCLQQWMCQISKMEESTLETNG